jgi:hypothetical protein
MPRAPVKDEDTYQALLREGNSKEKSARIANSAAGTSRRSVGARGGRSRPYEEWTKKELVQRAREIGIQGRSSMSKGQLVSALRAHRRSASNGAAGSGSGHDISAADIAAADEISG